MRRNFCFLCFLYFSCFLPGDASAAPLLTYRYKHFLSSLQPAPSWRTKERVWLYRGVETPWDAAEIDMAVPISPRELTQKIQAVYQHKSQRSQSAMAPGLHELWQQAERHNRALAAVYDELGLANYEAIEAFERFTP